MHNKISIVEFITKVGFITTFQCFNHYKLLNHDFERNITIHLPGIATAFLDYLNAPLRTNFRIVATSEGAEVGVYSTQ